MFTQKKILVAIAASIFWSCAQAFDDPGYNNLFSVLTYPSNLWDENKLREVWTANCGAVNGKKWELGKFADDRTIYCYCKAADGTSLAVTAANATDSNTHALGFGTFLIAFVH
ncbi:hypothetical protein CBOM_03087 [Ceraceosorus bombacis]|uniref:Uncharacterized protein n=1 Tax=Ceraceosorus bombacis TaxID=401625 RepID=A0A0P1BL62_9BASI|nr:hypothetical protein CBOM_03087 [Ceraceosorus bombacis]